VIIPTLGIIVGISLNQEPVPGDATLPLMNKVNRIPRDIEAAHEAKNIEAIELLTKSIKISGLPSTNQDVSSREYLVALDIAKWNPITIESNIEDSSFLFDWDRSKEDTDINAKVKPSRGLTGVN
jgi:hypothetical protein